MTKKVANNFYHLNEKTVFAAGGRTLFKTQDGGQAWQKIDVELPSQKYFMIHSVWFADSLQGLLSCARTDGKGIFKTTDGGHHWIAQLDQVNILDMFFLNDRLGWAGSWGAIYHTRDGGDSWELQAQQQFVEGVESIYFTTPDSGWAGGYLGLIRTIDGGRTWIPVVPAIPSFYIRDIHFINSREGWVVGDGGIYKTNDGGLSWEKQAHPQQTGAQPQSIYFTDRNNGWVVGTNFHGKVLHTSSGGRVWELMDFPAEHWLHRVRFFGKNYGWILGSGGTILRFAGDSTVPVRATELAVSPEGFMLWQNYPNPFSPQLRGTFGSPETTIHYYLSQAGNVQLAIYDVLGRLVRVLVDGVRPAGEHIEVWDGRNMVGKLAPSGAYFYVLKNKEKTLHSKRLLMIK